MLVLKSIPQDADISFVRVLRSSDGCRDWHRGVIVRVSKGQWAATRQVTGYEIEGSQV